MARLPLQLKPNRVGSSEVNMTTSMGLRGTNLRSQMWGWKCREAPAADAKPSQSMPHSRRSRPHGMRSPSLPQRVKRGDAANHS